MDLMGGIGTPVGLGSGLGVLLLTLLAGGIGAALRLVVTGLLPRRGVDVVNVLGTGLFVLVLALHGRRVLNDGTAVVLGLGLCGSLTTFSGWMAALTHPATVPTAAHSAADAHPRRPAGWGTLWRIVLPLFAGVGVTVLVFATIGSARVV